jgi:iron complex transport system ATP-binding protein
MLNISGLHFSYSQPVLRDLSCEIGDGELLVVIGPNGAGKSTLLKIMVGILSPESGRVLLDDRNLASMRRRDVARLIGYVAQGSSVRFPLTATEFVL